MNYRLVCHNIGLMCVLMAIAMACCLPWALPCIGGGEWSYEKNGFFGLVWSIVFTSLFGASFLSIGKGSENTSLFRREAIATVALDWTLAVAIGSLPYILFIFWAYTDGKTVPMSVADALYESTSGLTTTGGTILSELEDPKVMPRCILFWRSMTHFIGGLGIVVLLVALMDTGMAGRSLIQRELAEPVQSVYSRTQAILRRTVGVYLMMNVVLGFLLYFAGMTPFDALCHTFGTVATGGMGTHNNSLVYFQTDSHVNAAMVEWSMGIFMFIAGMNFLLLYFFAIGKWKYLVGNFEWRLYLLMVALATIAIYFYNAGTSDGGFHQTLRHSFFHVVSICTTTGFACEDYSRWLPQAQAILVLLMFVCACSGSTSGGPKIVRYILLYKLFTSESERFYRPNIVRPVTFNGETLNDTALARGVMLYFASMAVVLMVAWFLLMLLEPNTQWQNERELIVQRRLAVLEFPPDEPKLSEIQKQTLLKAAKYDADSQSWDLFVASIAHFSNVGPASGVLGPMGNFGGLTVLSKLLLVCLMLVGRLEIFGFILLFSPAFWRK